MEYDPKVVEEVLRPEKQHEEVSSILGRKRSRNESVDKNVSGCGALRTMEISHKKNEQLN